MNKPIKIFPLKDVFEEEENSYNEILPVINRNRGFNMVIMGSTKCGKTCFINNLLLSEDCWGGKQNAFDEVYFFSPSVNLDYTRAFYYF